MSGTIGKMTWDACNTCEHHSDEVGCDVPVSIENIKRVDEYVECFDYIEVST